MNLRIDMETALRRGLARWPDASSTLVACLSRMADPAGGFVDRAGQRDLYYTSFGMELLHASTPSPAMNAHRSFLESFGDGRTLDLLSMACLARSWRIVHGRSAPLAPGAQQFTASVARFRSPDGGYGLAPAPASANVYACFLALLLMEDCNQSTAPLAAMIPALQALRQPDGSYVSDSACAIGAVPPTAAALQILWHFREPVDRQSVEWILCQQRPEGGFAAIPAAPAADLLATAVALHALASCGVDPGPARTSACFEFVRSLWHPETGFQGYPGDPVSDCEYMFYGFLAAGHLPHAI